MKRIATALGKILAILQTNRTLLLCSSSLSPLQWHSGVHVASSFSWARFGKRIPLALVRILHHTPTVHVHMMRLPQPNLHRHALNQVVIEVVYPKKFSRLRHESRNEFESGQCERGSSEEINCVVSQKKWMVSVWCRVPPAKCIGNGFRSDAVVFSDKAIEEHAFEIDDGVVEKSRLADGGT